MVETFEVLGKKYAFNMGKVMDFVNDVRKGDNPKSSSKTETWGLTSEDDGEIRMLSKEVTEQSIEKNESMINIRYDFFKAMLSLFTSPFGDTTSMLIKVDSLDDMSFAQVMVFNTFLTEGIIYEISERE